MRIITWYLNPRLVSARMVSACSLFFGCAYADVTFCMTACLSGAFKTDTTHAGKYSVGVGAKRIRRHDVLGLLGGRLRKFRRRGCLADVPKPADAILPSLQTTCRHISLSRRASQLLTR